MAERPAAGGVHQQSLAKLEYGERDGVHWVEVSGELDISNVDGLRELAMQIPNRALGLVVDLSDAVFIDSATVGLLYELRQGLGRRSQVLRVVCPPSSPAARVLTMMSFDERMLSDGDVEEAIDAIRREVPLRP